MDLIVERKILPMVSKFFKLLGGKAPQTPRFSFSELQNSGFQNYGREWEQRKPTTTLVSAGTSP